MSTAHYVYTSISFHSVRPNNSRLSLELLIKIKQILTLTESGKKSRERLFKSTTIEKGVMRQSVKYKCLLNKLTLLCHLKQQLLPLPVFTVHDETCFLVETNRNEFFLNFSNKVLNLICFVAEIDCSQFILTKFGQVLVIGLFFAS